MLDQLKKMQPQKIETQELQKSDSQKCDSQNCGHAQQWLPRGSENWRCEICDPPKKEIFVSRRRDLRSDFRSDLRGGAKNETDAADASPQKFLATTIAAPIIIAHEHPICPHCLSTWTVESYGLDGATRCWSCKRVLTRAELLLPLPEHTQRKLLPWSEEGRS